MRQAGLRFAAPGEIWVGGYVGRIIDFTVENQLTDADTWALLVEQFRRCEDGNNLGWRGEYWGKMMRGASLTYAVTNSARLYSVLVDTMEDMLTTQDSLGRFATYSVEREFRAWDVWSRKYVMLGMIYFLEICKSEDIRGRVIAALQRHADYIIEHVGEGEGKVGILETSENIGGMNSASILEPFVKLYGITAEQRYLDFAAYLIDTGLSRGGNIIDLALGGELYPYQFPNTKAYEMLSCFEGVLEYYLHTGNEDHLFAVERFADMLIKSDYTIVGGAGCNHEFLDNSSITQIEPAVNEVMQETCVTVTLIKLMAKLLLVTGNVKYASYIERSGLNAMMGAVNNRKQKMKHALVRTWLRDGEVYYIKDHESYPFDSYSPLYLDRRGKRCAGVQLLAEGRSYGCCVCIGSAGTAITGLFTIMRSEREIFVNLYNDCRFDTEMDGDLLQLFMRADPYEASYARIKIRGNNKSFTLSLRIPEWAEGFDVLVNDTEVPGASRGGYLKISREWNDDTVEVRFTAPVKMRVLNGKIAFTKGAIALTRDVRLDKGLSPIAIKGGDGSTVCARRVENTVFESNLAYEIKTEDGVITLCDYAEAGKNLDDSTSLITVWNDVR